VEIWAKTIATIFDSRRRWHLEKLERGRENLEDQLLPKGGTLIVSANCHVSAQRLLEPMRHRCLRVVITSNLSTVFGEDVGLELRPIGFMLTCYLRPLFAIFSVFIRSWSHSIFPFELCV